MKKIIAALLTFAVAFSAGLATPPLSAYAETKPSTTTNAGTETSSGACTSASTCVSAGLDSAGGSENKTDAKALIKTIVSVLMFILGALAVIMIIVGGIRYTTSNGDASRIKAAKDTIMYSVVGLVVALLAYAIVRFIVDNIK